MIARIKAVAGAPQWTRSGSRWACRRSVVAARNRLRQAQPERGCTL